MDKYNNNNNNINNNNKLQANNEPMPKQTETHTSKEINLLLLSLTNQYVSLNDQWRYGQG